METAKCIPCKGTGNIVIFPEGPKVKCYNCMGKGEVEMPEETCNCRQGKDNCSIHSGE